MENKCCTSLMDATAYTIAYNAIYNRLKAKEQTLELIRVKETKL